jgi:hypothetical protein
MTSVHCDFGIMQPHKPRIVAVYLQPNASTVRFDDGHLRYEEDRARSDAYLRKNEEAAAADRRKVLLRKF